MQERVSLCKLSFIVVYLKSGPGVNAELVTQDEK